MRKEEIRSLDLEQLKQAIGEMGEKPFRGKQIYEWIHKKLASSFEDMSNISKDFREKLTDKYTLSNLELVEQLVSEQDGTTKFLFRLFDGKVIESVLMKYKHGNSVCISSQVGCKMGCKFCASTIGGLERNLTSAEMLAQIYEIQKISNERVSNVVIMGTGEPFDNFDNFIKFVKMISDENGLNISQRNITVSTCGLVEQIIELAEYNLQITLAVSLHASNDEVRKQLMPIANRYEIQDIIDACKLYYEKTGRRITVEYSLVEGINDFEEHARELCKIIRKLHAHVNLIPVNPIKEQNYNHSSSYTIQKFKNILEKNKINVTIRREMGRDIDAACGQLRKRYMDSKVIE